MEALARESWKSGGGSAVVCGVEDMFVGREVGVTTSSRHWGVREWEVGGVERGIGWPLRP